MIPIGKINFGQFKIPGNIPDIPGFGASIPGGPGAEQMPPGIAAGIDAKRPALGQPGFDTIFGGQKIPPTASVSPDPYKNYSVADTYKQSDFYDNSMNSQGYLDFLENARNNFMMRDMQQDMKSAAYNDARGKIFDAYDTFNPITNQDEMDAFYSENPYKLMGPGAVRKYDDGFFNPFTGDPTETAPPGSPGPDTGFGPSNMQPILTPGVDYLKQASVPEYFTNAMPDFGEPPTQQPTGGMNSDFANQLLSGIGNLFDKYLSSPSMKQNNLGMGSTNQITPPPPPEAPMTADTSSSLPNTLGSQGMFTPGRGY